MQGERVVTGHRPRLCRFGQRRRRDRSAFRNAVGVRELLVQGVVVWRG